MRIVQVCNVGQICGGTAACAWSITRALPECHHLVLCLSRPTEETVRAFAPVEIGPVSRLDDAVFRPLRPDLVILHNTAQRNVGLIREVATLQYQHSQTSHAAANFTVACSEWLTRRLSRSVPVLYQPVPIPPKAKNHARRVWDDRLIVGRICTPQPRKWPNSCCGDYEWLARRFPNVEWEFVGCPEHMRRPILEACRGRARFWPASWMARSHLFRWDVLLYHHPDLTESFGRTVAESMLAGCLPIVDHRGGFLEQVTCGNDGWTCRSLKEFAEALALASDPSVRRRMSAAACETARIRFSSHAFAMRFRQQLKAFLCGK